ncbi:hypothetical protein ACJJTC_017915 [Scirpophaga incertulas]
MNAPMKKKLHTELQNEKANPVKLLSSLMELLCSVCQGIPLPSAATTNYKDYINLKIKDHLSSVPYLGYHFESQLQKLPTHHNLNITVIKGRCVDFNVKLAQEIRKRLSDNYKTLEKITLLSEDETLKKSKDTLRYQYSQVKWASLSKKLSKSCVSGNNTYISWIEIR